MCIACGFTSLFIYVHVIHDVENRWCKFQNDSFLWGKTNQYIGVASFTFTAYYTFKSYNKNQRSKQEIQHGSEVLLAGLSSNKHFKLRLHNMLSVRLILLNDALRIVQPQRNLNFQVALEGFPSSFFSPSIEV